MVSKIMKKMIDYFDGDLKRINHAIKVYTFSKTIAKLEVLEDEKLVIIEITSILHDIGIKISEEKYNSSLSKYQELEGPSVAEDILKDFNLDRKIIERVKFIIGNHHNYKKIDDLDFQILIEADFIVNAFEDNMNPEQIKKISKNVFKTKRGTELLNSMYK